MRVQGDYKALRHLIYNQRLSKLPDEKTPGPLTLAIEDFGGFIVADGTESTDAMILPPVGSDDVGQFVELYTKSFEYLEIGLAGGDSITGSPTTSIGFCNRAKAKCVSNNTWTLADRRHATSMVQAPQCCVVLAYDGTAFQTLASGIGDPPPYAAADVLDVSQGTAIVDYGAMYQPASDGIEIQSGGYYLIEADATFKGSGTGTSDGFFFLGRNGSLIAVQGKSIQTTYPQTIRLSHVVELDSADTLDLRAASSNAESMALMGFQWTVRQLPSASMREEPLVADVDTMLAFCDLFTLANSSPLKFNNVDINTGSSISLDTTTGIFTLQPGTYYLEAGMAYNFNAAAGYDTWQWHDSVPNPFGTKVRLTTHVSGDRNGSFTNCFGILTVAGPGSSTASLRRATEGGANREFYWCVNYALVRKLR